MAESIFSTLNEEFVEEQNNEEEDPEILKNNMLTTYEFKTPVEYHNAKSLNDVIKNSFHSFIATFFLIVLGIIAAIIAGYIVDKNFFTLLLSYCPGGIYEVAVIAIAFDLDPDFVSFHHIIRLLMILFIVPLILKLIKKKGSSNP